MSKKKEDEERQRQIQLEMKFVRDLMARKKLREEKKREADRQISWERTGAKDEVP